MIILSTFLIIVAVILIEVISLKNAMTSIDYEITPGLILVEPEQEFEFLSVVQNKANRFVTFLEIGERFPKEVVIKSKSAITRSTFVELTTTHFLMPRQKLERKIKATILKRGRYPLLNSILGEGDFLGIRRVEKTFKSSHEIVVMPKSAQLSDFEISLAGFIGDLSANRFIFEDPVLTVGFGDYTGREPLRSISWTQTAKTGNLTVKKYDHTVQPTVAVILNTHATFEDKEQYQQALEKCFSITRTVCQHLESQKIKYKFFTNASVPGFNGSFDTHYSAGGSQYLISILECLGRAIYGKTCTFKVLSENAMKYSEYGQGFIIITPDVNDDFHLNVHKLTEAAGFSPCILNASEEAE